MLTRVSFWVFPGGVVSFKPSTYIGPLPTSTSARPELELSGKVGRGNLQHIGEEFKCIVAVHPTRDECVIDMAASYEGKADGPCSFGQSLEL
jgi:hypothetical protein